MMEKELSDLTKDALAYGVYQKSLDYYRKKWKWIAGFITTIIVILGYMGYNFIDLTSRVQSNMDKLEQQIEMFGSDIDSLESVAQKSKQTISEFEETTQIFKENLYVQEKEITNRMIASIVNSQTNANDVLKQTTRELENIINKYTQFELVKDSMINYLSERKTVDLDITNRLEYLEDGVDSIFNTKYFPLYLQTNSTTTLKKFDLIVHLDGTRKNKGVSESVKGLTITNMNDSVVYYKELTTIGSDEAVVEPHTIKSCQYKITFKPIYIFEQFIEHGLVLFQVETVFLSPKERPDICPL